MAAEAAATRWPDRLWMAVAATLVASCADLAPVAPPAEQFAADCAEPTYATDMLVCGDPGLRGLDAELARLWAEIGSSGDPAAADAQATWFRERSRCAFEEDHRGCAEAAYRARIAALRVGAALP
jgi:uncharacterized protein